jgi:hypothetical protein
MAKIRSTRLEGCRRKTRHRFTNVRRHGKGSVNDVFGLAAAKVSCQRKFRYIEDWLMPVLRASRPFARETGYSFRFGGGAAEF